MRRLVLISTALLCIIAYFYFCIPDCMRLYTLCFGVPGEVATAPGKYRILQGLVESAVIPRGSNEAVLLADFGIQAVLTVLIMFGLDAWLRRWVSEDRALIGVLLFSLILVVSYHFFLRGLSISFEVVFMLGVLWLLPRSLYSPV